jgi:hypothetical protein
VLLDRNGITVAGSPPTVTTIVLSKLPSGLSRPVAQSHGALLQGTHLGSNGEGNEDIPLPKSRSLVPPPLDPYKLDEV